MQLYGVLLITPSSLQLISLHQQKKDGSLKCKAHANLSEQISRYNPQWAENGVDTLHE